MSTACVPAPLSGTQLQAVAALLAGLSPAEIARDCGVSPRTLRQWQQQPGFRVALLEGQSRLLQETCLQLAAAASVAIRTLTEICQDSGQKGPVRVAAAGKLLDFLFRSAPQVAASLAAAPPAPAPQPAETVSPASPAGHGPLRKMLDRPADPIAAAPAEAVFALPPREPHALPSARSLPSSPPSRLSSSPRAGLNKAAACLAGIGPGTDS